MIGVKVKDLGSVGNSEYTLLNKLPDQGSPMANWAQSASFEGLDLRSEDHSVVAGG